MNEKFKIKDITDKIKNSLKYDETLLEKVINSYFERTADYLKKEKRQSLPGLGTIKLRWHKSREIFNPKLNENITVNAHYAPRFHTAIELQEKIDQAADNIAPTDEEKKEDNDQSPEMSADIEQDIAMRAAAGKRSSARKAQTESDSKDRASVDNTEDDPFNDEAEFNEADTGDDNEIKKEEPESEKAGRESDTDAGTDENEASELETTIELSDDNSDPNDTETDLTEEKASESVENSKADSDHISAPAASNESEMVEEELTAQPEDTSPPAEQDEAAEKESSEETEAAAAPESAAQSSMENDAQEDETEFKQNINTGAEEQTEQTASLSAENEQNSSNSTEEDKNNEKENSDKNENDTVSLQSNFENDLKNELVDNVQQTQSSTDNSEPSAAAPSSDEKQKSRKPFYIIMISSVFILIFMAVFFADYYAQWNIIERLFPAGWSWWDDGYKGPLDQNFLDKSGADNVYGTPAGRKVHRGELKRKNALITTNYNKAASRETSAAKKTDQTAIPTGKRVYIEWGQTLTAIAAREYNNADFWPYIYYNNIKTLQSPDELVPVRDRIVLTYRTNANLGDLYFRLFIYYKKLSSRKKYAMLKKAYLYNSGRLESERDQISATEKKFLNRLK